MPSNVVPVILCGGEGTRLWPVSRKAMPKQFARFDSPFSLLQETVQRMEDSGFTQPLLVTNDAYRFTVADQLNEIGVQGAQILIEPEARGTAPAICAAAEYLRSQDSDALMLIVPSDQLVRDQMAFARAVAAGVSAARDGQIVTFGIRPHRAETGYGYVELSDPRGANEVAQPFLRFFEKPSAVVAEGLTHSNRHVWNAGIFLMSVSTALSLFQAHQPDILNPVRQAVEEMARDLDFSRLGGSYSEAPAISFDKAVLEDAVGYVVPFAPGWADLGSWRAVWEESDRDAGGVAQTGDTHALNCENTLLRSEGVRLVGVGLKNIAAVAMGDAVLISDLDNTQNVSLAVGAMRQDAAKEADDFPRHDRPWGHYETLSLGERFQVKSISVKPGGKLSLQSHVHRAEHWIVVEGTATVTIGAERKLISENQSVYIPLGEVHRLENEGKLPLRLIEVQTGCYLGEDDIVRYEDVYARA